MTACDKLVSQNELALTDLALQQRHNHTCFILLEATNYKTDSAE